MNLIARKTAQQRDGIYAVSFVLIILSILADI